MKNHVLALALLLFGLCLPQPEASTVIQLFETGTTNTALSVSPGGAFNINVIATNVQPETDVLGSLDSLTYRILFPNENFTLTSNAFAAPFDNTLAPTGFNGSVPWTGLPVLITNTADAGSPLATPGVPDLYRTTATTTGVGGIGDVLVETLGLEAPAAPGNYALTLLTLEAADEFGAFHTTTDGVPFSVTVVPLPPALGLFLAGLFALIRLRSGSIAASVAVAAVLSYTVTGPAQAGPFVPLEWQQQIKSGDLAGERKHLEWSGDVNGNFVDDALEALDPGSSTDVIVQLSQCEERNDLISQFSAFGTVATTGTLVGYVELQNVPVNRLEELGKTNGVAAVEADAGLQLFLDTSTRSIRARASNTFTPETFEEAFGVDGSGVNIAVVDSGVDNTVHAGFAGKFVSGYNAITEVAGDPDDDNTCIHNGFDGVTDTTAAGTDVQVIPVGQGEPDDVFCVLEGPNMMLDSTVVNDDTVSIIGIEAGPDGICDSTAQVDDIQLIQVGQGLPRVCAVWPGADGTIESVPSGNDTLVTTFHGTHVAGIALGLGAGTGCSPADDGSIPNDCQGVAFGAGLVDVKVANPSGSIFTSDAIAALDWLWQDGNTDVVNLSFGDDFNEDGTSTQSQLINALVANDIPVAVAAGNSGANRLGETASATLAVTVANARDQNTVDPSDDNIAPSSTFGPRVDFDPMNLDIGMLKPDVSAPGTFIFSAEGNSANDYHSLSGTSMASPHVAGAMALLIDLRPDVTPGALKDVLKRTAMPIGAASFPATDAVYNIRSGYGEIDLWQAATQLQAGIADVAFGNCTGPNPAFPTVKPCVLGDGSPPYANSVDITLDTDPPLQGIPNTIFVNVENRTSTAADDVVVCVGVKEFGVGLQEFYGVGCRQIDLGALAGDTVSIPWTPSASDHQCIQASIDYGFDTEFNNNITQRNTSPEAGSSPAQLQFRVENPLHEDAVVEFAELAIEGDFRLFQVVPGQPPQTPPFLYREVRVADALEPVRLTPQNCPILKSDLVAIPNPAAPVGATGIIRIGAVAQSRTYPQGLPLSGVEFKLTKVAPGLERAYSLASHRQEGEIPIPLNLAGVATSDPRREVSKVLAVFNVPVRPEEELDPQSVRISSASGKAVPSYTVTMVDPTPFLVEGVTAGREFLIQFAAPLENEERYSFEFDTQSGSRLLDIDGDTLTGDSNFDLRILQGDANGSGIVTATDVSFVRGRIGQTVVFGDTARADVNLTGTNTATDISFVRGRIGASAP
jgi:subtilisin family serine protease